jgi:hypothetical protein
MTKASLTMVLLVAAALAGCTGGTDEGQIPIDSFTESGTTSGSSGDTGTDRPRGQGRNNQSYEPYLEAHPDNGTAPLNVTLEFGVTWFDNGQHRGQQDGTGARGNQTGASGNQTGNSTGNSTGNQTGGPGGSNSSGNRTGNEPGEHDLNRGHAKGLNWTLEVRYNATASNGTGGNATGNSTGNGTAGGSNGTSTGTGSTSSSTTTTSSTGTTTSSSSTGTGSSGNTTGNGTGNSTGNGTGNSTSGNSMAHGTVVASFNGTGEELPSNRTVTLNETGTYDAVFTVNHENGTTQTAHATITVSAIPPGTPLGNETQVFEGGFPVSGPGLCLNSEDFEWVLNGTFNGTPAEIDQLNVTVESSGFGEVELTLTAPDGTEIQTGSEINATGPFEPGNYTLTASSCTSVNSEFVATAVAHYVTPRRTVA